jgi:hypothetical protein
MRVSIPSNPKVLGNAKKVLFAVVKTRLASFRVIADFLSIIQSHESALERFYFSHPKLKWLQKATRFKIRQWVLVTGLSA